MRASGEFAQYVMACSRQHLFNQHVAQYSVGKDALMRIFVGLIAFDIRLLTAKKLLLDILELVDGGIGMSL
jgi:hypothetical protein